MRHFSFVLVLLSLGFTALESQQRQWTVPTVSRWSVGSQIDPFRMVSTGRRGVLFSTGGFGANNVLNLSDVGAITYLDRNDAFGVADLMDATTLIPVGEGLVGAGQLEAGIHVGLPLRSDFALAVSTSMRAYGDVVVDDTGITLFRDGNANRQEFSLGQSHGVGLSTAELGVHAFVHPGILSSEGRRVSVGFGVRLVRAALFGQMRSLVSDGGTLLVAPDSIAADLGIEVMSTTDAMDRVFGRGRMQLMGDFLVRAAWSGFALEGAILNVGGALDIRQVERRAETVQIETRDLDSLLNYLDTVELGVVDSTDASITVPKLFRVTASTALSSGLQLDLSGSGSLGGDIDVPLTVDVGSTVRLVRQFPVHAGLVLGGRQGVGYSAGFGLELPNVAVRFSGHSLGGLFRHATGVGGGIELGIFF